MRHIKVWGGSGILDKLYGDILPNFIYFASQNKHEWSGRRNKLKIYVSFFYNHQTSLLQLRCDGAVNVSKSIFPKFVSTHLLVIKKYYHHLLTISKDPNQVALTFSIKLPN